MLRRWAFLIIATIVVALDQLSKSWIRSNISFGEEFFQFGRLTLVHVWNTGAAFGMFTDQTVLLSVIAIAGLVLILILYRQMPASIIGSLALGLVFGGAIGNLTDRLRLGHVTDFIDVRLWDDYHWPAFNVADSCITIGTITLAIFIIIVETKKDNARKSRTTNI